MQSFYSFRVSPTLSWHPVCRAIAPFAVWLSLVVILFASSNATANVDGIISKGLSTAKSGAASQKKIDEISEQIDQLTNKYKREAKSVESLKVYNDRMRRTIEAQNLAMQRLERSIEDASLIERQIVPLMLRMIAGLESFVEADIPFKKQERFARIERIKGYLNNANISAAERFRQVLDAYTIESDYGDSIDVYRETLSIDGESITANILQVGRAGLYYQTLDGARSGYWDKASKQWTSLEASHNEGISHAIRMTQGKESKGLMTLPLVAPEAS